VRRDDRGGTRSRALSFEVLAFCEGSARCLGRGEIAATNNSGEAGGPRAGEQLWVQEAPGIGPLPSAGRRSARLRRESGGWPRGDPHPEWIRKRFRLENAVAPPAHRGLREELVTYQ